MSGVYLLHFESPYQHARHYIGWAKDIDARVSAHVSGRGSKLTQAVHYAGIAMQLVRKWTGETRGFERKLKNRKNAAQLCPICVDRFNKRAAANMRKYRAKP